MRDGEPDPRAIDRRRRIALSAVVAILVIHACQCVRLFPSLRSINNADPVIMVDHAIHLYHGALGSAFLRDHGRSWGIDPFFMAGYPETPVWDSSANLSILFQRLGGGGYRPAAYKIGLLITSWLTIALIPLAARLFGLTLAESAIAALFCWLSFWIGRPAMFWRSGLCAFVFASSLSLYTLGALVRYAERPSFASWLNFAGASGLLVYSHVTAAVLVAGGALGFAVAGARKLPRSVWAGIAGAMLLAVALNQEWLRSLWRFRGIRAVKGIFMAPTDPLHLLRSALDGSGDGLLGAALAILGVAGIRVLRRNRPPAWSICGSSTWLFVLTSFGGLIPGLRSLEPLRFAIPLQFTLALPAAVALLGCFRLVARAPSSRRIGALALAAMACAGAGVLGRTELTRSFQRLVGARPLTVGLPEEFLRLIDLLERETDPSARILFEDQLRLLETTDPESAHASILLPRLMGRDRRQLIGGDYQMAFIAHHDAASFGDFTLAGARIDRWSAVRFREYADRYNLGWVVAWSPLSRFVFDRMAGLERIASTPRWSSPGPAPPPPFEEYQAIARAAGESIAKRYLLEGSGRYVLYRIARPRTFFLSGQGQWLATDDNAVTLGDVLPGRIVLSLHWIDGWATDPPLVVEPVEVPGDPVPFVGIRVDRPLRRIVLSNAYRQ